MKGFTLAISLKVVCSSAVLLDMTLGPLSEVISEVVPKKVTQEKRNVPAVSEDVVEDSGTVSDQLLVRSTTVSRCIKPV